MEPFVKSARAPTDNTEPLMASPEDSPRKQAERRKRERNRFINRYGHYNISHKNVPSSYKTKARDLFNTMVNLKWRYTTLGFFSVFTLCWLTFAVIFYINMLVHGDFDQHDPDEQFTPCIQNIDGFIGVFMFSFESQTTIGFGFRYTTELCPMVWILTCVQNLTGAMMQGMLLGLIFAKLARAKKRNHTVIFSDTATIAMRDGKLCFLFRVGDLLKTQLIEAHIRIQLIDSRVTAEGEHIPYYLHEMNVGYGEGQDRLFMLFPQTICHIIDEHSPLYDIGPDDLQSGKCRFEIVVLLEGTVESVGATTQCMHSYVSSDVVWGHRFQTIVGEESKTKGHVIDFSLFHNTVPVAVPMYSAKQLDKFRSEGVDLDKLHKFELPYTPTTPNDNNGSQRLSVSTFEDQNTDRTSYTASPNSDVMHRPQSLTVHVEENTL